LLIHLLFTLQLGKVLQFTSSTIVILFMCVIVLIDIDWNSPTIQSPLPLPERTENLALSQISIHCSETGESRWREQLEDPAYDSPFLPPIFTYPRFTQTKIRTSSCDKPVLSACVCARVCVRARVCACVCVCVCEWQLLLQCSSLSLAQQQPTTDQQAATF